MQPNRKAFASGLPCTPIEVKIRSQLCFIIFLNFCECRSEFIDTPLTWWLPFGVVNGFNSLPDYSKIWTLCCILVSRLEGEPLSITRMLKVFLSDGRFKC